MLRSMFMRAWPRAMSVEHHADGGGKFRLQQVRGQLGDRHGIAQSRRPPQNVFRGFHQRVQARAAAGENHARSQQFIHASLPQVIAQQFHQFARARLQNLAQHALLHQARGTVAHRWHLDLVALGNAGHDGAAEHLLDVLGVGNGRAEADGNVVGEMVSADRNCAGVNHHAFVVHDEVGRSGANVGQADAQFALVGLQHGVGAGQRFEHGVVNVNAGAVRRRDYVLRRRGAGGDHVDAHFDFLAHQSGRIVHSGLAVDE